MKQAFDDRTGGHGAQGDAEEFSRILGAYNHDIVTQGRNGMFSAHKVAENVYVRLLNALYGWSLVNDNEPGHSVEAVDLVDDVNRIVVQVTATCSSAKINSTLDSPKAAWYYERGFRLKFAFVGSEHDARKVQGTGSGVWALHDHNEDMPGFFDRKKDTLFTSNLVAKFEELGPATRLDVLNLVRGDIGKVSFVSTLDAGYFGDNIVRDINKRLERQRRDHPSFRLMEGDPKEELFPNGTLGRRAVTIPNARRMVRTADDSTVPFREFVRDSWDSGSQTHLLITGRGGVGKTVALLTFATEEGFLPRGVPAVYIPLYDLVQYADAKRGCIDCYLEREFSEEECKAIQALSKEQWRHGPNVILLLDGRNEIPSKVASSIDLGIRAWAGRAGTQVVTASRVAGSVGVAATQWLDLQGLSKEDVRTYLGDNAPEDGDERLWRLLETPLMLRLYSSSKGYAQDDLPEYLRMEETDSAGHLVWNCLQRELWRLTDLHVGESNEIDYAFTLLLTLPYVCWRMETANDFKVDRDSLIKYVEEACKIFDRQRDRPRSFLGIEGRLSRASAEGKETGRSYAQFDILANEIALLVKQGGRYALMHQSLRDGLAAIHLRNVIEVSHKKLPLEFKQPISEYVKDFLVELLAGDGAWDKLLLKMWKANRKERPTHAMATYNLLRIIHKFRNADLSELKWSGMDLREISLFGFSDSETRLRLSKGESDFKRTKLDSSCFMQQGHTDIVNSVDFSTDGTVLVSGSDDATLRLWDVATGRRVATPIKAQSRVKSVCLSPDGLSVAGGLADGRVCLWDVKTGELKIVFRGHKKSVKSVCFSPDGTLIASGSRDRTIRLWKVATESRTASLAGHGGSVSSVCFSPDGALIASGSRDRTIRLWDAGSGTCLKVLEGCEAEVTSVCFGPARPVLASTSSDGFVHLWPVGTDGIMKPDTHTLASKSGALWSVGGTDGIMKRQPLGGRVACAACFSPDGSLLLLGFSDGLLLLMDAETLRPVSTLRYCHSDQVTSLRFRSDGMLFASGSWDRTVRLGDCLTGQQVGEPLGGYRDKMTSVHVSRDGLSIASGSEDGTVRLWDPITGRQTGKSFGGLGRPITSICFSPDKAFIAGGSRDGSVNIWSSVTGQDVIDSHVHQTSRVTSIHFSPDGKLVASGSEDGSVFLWETTSGHQVGAPLVGHRYGIGSVRFNIDGSLLASASWDGTVRLWDWASSRQVGEPLMGHKHGVDSVRFSPDRKLLASGSWDGTICLWDLQTRKRIGEPLGAYWLSIKSICFSPDGLLVAGGTSDGSVYVWEVASGELVHVLHGSFRQSVESISLTKDGNVLATGLTGNTFWLWNKSLLSKSDEVGYFTGILEPLFGIDLSGLNFSKATMTDHDREVLRQNGVTV